MQDPFVYRPPARERAIQLFEEGLSMNNIATALQNESYFDTHTQALVFAGGALANRSTPRAVSRFSWPNFAIGTIVFAFSLTEVGAILLFFRPLAGLELDIFIFFAAVGLVLFLQEPLLFVGILPRRITDLEQVWRMVMRAEERHHGGPRTHL